MKFVPISRKLNIFIVSISMIFLIIASFVLFIYSVQTKNKVYENIKQDLKDDAFDKIEAKMKIGITNAISIANDERIKKGLKTNSREESIQTIQNISKAMKENTEYQNIKIHIHTKDNFSFIRSWKPEQYGDDLSIFRKAVVEVNKNKKSLTTFEAGKRGITFKSNCSSD